jgi:BolA protein
MPVADEMQARLEAAFDVKALDIVDESESHRGHAGFQEGGESHFRIRLTAPEFGDMTRIARHRAVHEALGKDLVGRIHALALELNG